MKCGYCNSIFKTTSSHISRQMGRTERLSCGCMTSKWRAVKTRETLPEYVNKWKIIKDITNGEKYTNRKVIAVCPICNKEHKSAIGNLKHMKSCGCLKSEYAKKRRSALKHSNPRLYRMWQGMKARCNIKSASGYKHYGKRGIKVCKQWTNFEPFCIWALENGYSDEKSIDRIDSDKDYMPENCRFITLKMNKSLGHIRGGNGQRPKKYKISIDDASEICEAYDNGIKASDMANHYGVKASMIYGIICKARKEGAEIKKFKRNG